MTTALDIINRAYRSAQILGEGETASGDMVTDGLVYLNDLIERLSNEHLTIFQESVVTHTLDGSQSYSWGSGGDISSTRPLKISSAYHTVSNVDYPVSILTKQEYDSFSFKSSDSDVVDFIYLRNDYPTANLFVYPISSSGTLNMTVWVPLSKFSAVTDTVSFPNGYEGMLRTNLAIDMCSEYNIQPNPTLAINAQTSLANIKRVNKKQGILRTNIPVTDSRYGSYIERGY